VREWERFENRVRRRALACTNEEGTWNILARSAREVLRKYSSSFFIVTRFLPFAKRQEVEIIYAAVRYPDEIVDTFPLSQADRIERLRSWRAAYDAAVACGSMREALQIGLPVFAAGFAEVVRRHAIPLEHYHSFLDAMELDVYPRHFASLRDLNDSYVYGSAVVVGYFLTYVYGSVEKSKFRCALESSKNLGIALQLTNFLRDVQEDRRRGRLYIPTEMLDAVGLTVEDIDSGANQALWRRLLVRFAQTAEQYYALSEKDLGAFSPDCLPAIKACIAVYRELNRRIIESPDSHSRRISVPLANKFRLLPASKFWRIPLGYLSSMVI
jgi:phytoene synthase